MALRGEVFRELEGRRTQRIQLGNKHYFLKQHFGVGWKEIFKNLFQGRLPVVSAKNEKSAIELLNHLGVATLSLKGYGCRGLNPATLHSFLLTEELTDCVSLEELGVAWKTQKPDRHFKRDLIRKVAEIARLMHSHGMNHRDFYLCHFLWQPSTHQLYLIDLHRSQIRSNTPVRWLIKDLSGLYFSSQGIGLTTRDYWRFIREYRQRGIREVWQKERTFWNQVLQRGKKMYEAYGT